MQKAMKMLTIGAAIIALAIGGAGAARRFSRSAPAASVSHAPHAGQIRNASELAPSIRPTTVAIDPRQTNVPGAQAEATAFKSHWADACFFGAALLLRSQATHEHVAG